MIKLESDTLDWALKHCEKIGHLSLFPLPFEFEAIRHQWAKVKLRLLKIDLPNNWKIRPCRIIYAPKHHYGFRICTQLDPLDEIIYNGLIYEIGEDIEKKRIPKSKEIVLSNRFKPTEQGDFWDLDYTYSKFEERTDNLLEDDNVKYIIEADIADFFPRIYTHILYNQLKEVTDKEDHINSIMKMLKDLYQKVSYGIPVGSDASFLLAENFLHQVDERLIDEKANYLRYVDDFRIFCTSKSDAYQKLHFLAETIFKSLSLTLQQQKTKIYNKKRYNEIRKRKNQEVGPLSRKFKKFVGERLKETNIYGEIKISKLTNKQKKELRAFSFEEIIKEQIKKELINIPLVKFALNRLIQINNPNVIYDILDNFEKFYPVVKDVIIYIISLRNNSSIDKSLIGKKIIGILLNSYIGHSEFNRLWLLYCFTLTKEWDNENHFITLFKKFDDIFTRRKLILAMGRAHKVSWFQSERRDILQTLSSWERRAFIAGFSCCQEDVRKHWYSHIRETTHDFFDEIIINWVIENSF